jgi:hypothetical protein
MSDYTMSRPDFKAIAPSGRLPYAKISAWCIQHLNNAQRLVIEGIFCELAVGESAIATSAEIAGWANVSEATVSRALPGLAAKGLIALSRVYYSETGRTRWSLRHLPAQPNGSYAPGWVGSDMDASAAQFAPVGSDMGGSAAGSAAQSISPDSGVPMPESAEGADSAAERLPSMTDPTIFYDSDSPHKHARKHASAHAEEPHSRTIRTSPPSPAAPPPGPTSETPTVPAAFAELRQRGVIAYSATQILKHHPTMTGAEFDRLLDIVITTRDKAANPLKYLCGILQRGEMLDPPPQRMALPSRRKVNNMPILTARVDPQVKHHYCKIFERARTDDERVGVLERFDREVVAPAQAAAAQAKEATAC